MASNKRIEEAAINVLNAALLKCPYIETYIDSNDKTPSWDGDIIVFKKVGGKKENILGKIPIQVKGTEKNPVQKDGTATYSVNVADLRNYYHDGGIIFFVIFVNILMVSGKVYYADLLPYDLNRIVLEAKGKNNHTIHLKEFPINNTNEIANIFISFATNKPKQMGIIGKELPTIEGLEKKGARIESLTLGAIGVGLDQDNIGTFMASHSFYLYAKLKGSDIDIPVDKVSEAIVEKKICAPIFVNKKKFYDEYSVVYKGSSTFIKIGRSLTFNPEEKSGQFEFNIKGKIDEQIEDIDFLIEFINTEKISINGIEFQIDSADKGQIQRLNDLKKYWNDVQKMLKVLGVREKLECDQLTEKDYKNLRNFVNAVLYDERIGFPHIKENLTYGLFSIANLRILLWYEKQDDGFYKIESFFKPREIIYKSKQDEFSYKTSQFLLLKNLDFSHVSNLDIEIMLTDLNHIEISSSIAEQINFLLLNVLSGYDRQQVHHENQLLELCNGICRILEHDSVPIDKRIVQLNKLQLIKRQRKLSVDEIVQLSNLRDTENPLTIRCGAYILLDDFEIAKSCLDQMKVEEKEEFIKYPIYHFLSDNI